MKLALALMVNDNDLPFLKLHLPAFRNSFDGVVALADPVDGGNAIEYLLTQHVAIETAPWEYNWGSYATKLFNFAEQQGYDAAMRVDPDELLWSDTGYHIRKKLEDEATLLLFPRHEFFADRFHVRPELYPDHQARAWRLGRGIEVCGKNHEGIDFAAHGLSEDADDSDHKVMRLWEEKFAIYHYGWSSKTAIWAAMTKYQRQAQVALGQSPVVAFPPDQQVVSLPTVPYDRPSPLDPHVIGGYAPFDE